MGCFGSAIHPDGCPRYDQMPDGCYCSCHHEVSTCVGCDVEWADDDFETNEAGERLCPDCIDQPVPA